MHAHLVQLDPVWRSPHASLERAARLIDHAPLAQGDLVLFPEMFATGFSVLPEPACDDDGAVLAFLADLATRRAVTVQGGRVVRRGGLAFNVMSVLAPAAEPGPRRLCEYAKVHPFRDEAATITPGPGAAVYDLSPPFAPPASTPPPPPPCVAPLVCYDLRFPELFRQGLDLGAEIFALGACWPAVRIHHWRALLLARAIENQAIVLGCTRTGEEPSGLCGGGTVAFGPKGELLGELGSGEGVLTVPLDIRAVREWRARFPAAGDRRIPVAPRAEPDRFGSARA